MWACAERKQGGARGGDLGEERLAWTAGHNGSRVREREGHRPFERPFGVCPNLCGCVNGSGSCPGGGSDVGDGDYGDRAILAGENARLPGRLKARRRILDTDEHSSENIACSEEAVSLGKGHWAHDGLLAEGDQQKVSPGRWPASPGLTP